MYKLEAYVVVLRYVVFFSPKVSRNLMVGLTKQVTILPLGDSTITKQVKHSKLEIPMKIGYSFLMLTYFFTGVPKSDSRRSPDRTFL